MKKFLIKLAIFISPLIILFIIMEIGLSGVSNNFSKKKEYFEAQLDSTEVVILGTSHMIYGVDPKYISFHCFNLATFGQSLYFDSKILLKYLDRMPKLKVVVIEVNYFNLSFEVADIEPWKDYWYEQYWKVPYGNKPFYDYRRYSKMYLNGLENSFYITRHFFNIDNSQIDYRGFVKRDTTDNYKSISDTAGKNKVAYHEGLTREKNFVNNCNYLDELLHELTKRNIIPVVVTPPAYETYYKYSNRNILNRIDSTVNSLCTKYNCYYFSFFTDDRFTARDFADNDHLNFLGGAKFATIIDTAVLRPIIDSRQ